MAVLTSDSFNRSDGPLNGSTTDDAAGGSPKTWVTSGGDFEIISNKVSQVAGAGACSATVNVAATNHVVSATYTTPVTGSNSVGLVGRYIDLDNHYLLNHQGNLGITLYKMVAGSLTALTSEPITSLAAGDILTLSCVGTTISVLLNGVQVASVTDATHTTGTKVGWRVNASPDTWRCDNFLVTDGLTPTISAGVLLGADITGSVVNIPTITAGVLIGATVTGSTVAPPPNYEVVTDPNAAHVQDAPTADLQYMPDSHGADAPGIGYPPADQYRSNP